MKYYVNWTGRLLINEEQFNDIVAARADVMKQNADKMNQIIKELYDFFELYTDTLQKPEEVIATIADAVRCSAEWEIRQSFEEKEAKTEFPYLWARWQDKEILTEEEAKLTQQKMAQELAKDKQHFYEYLDENFEASEVYDALTNNDNPDNDDSFREQYEYQCDIDAEEEFDSFYKKVTVYPDKTEA